MNILLLQAYLANHLFFWVAVISTAIHITTRPQLYTLLKAMHLQAKYISWVRTIYLLPWEKTGQTKKELSAFWGKKKRREELQRWGKKRKEKIAEMECTILAQKKKYLILFNSLPVRKLASIHWNAWEDSPRWNKMPVELLKCEKIVTSTLSPKECFCFRRSDSLWIWLKMKMYYFLWALSWLDGTAWLTVLRNDTMVSVSADFSTSVSGVLSCRVPQLLQWFWPLSSLQWHCQ